MRRGTTPTLRFTMPYPLEMVRGGEITFVQQNEIVLRKSFEDECVSVVHGLVKVALTEEETLMFSSYAPGEAQLWIKLPGEKSAASDVVEFSITRSLRGGSQ